MKKTKKSYGYGIEDLAKLFPDPAKYMEVGLGHMNQKEEDGKKRIHIRTAIVAVLMAITAFLCFYFWTVSYAAFLFTVIVAIAAGLGVLFYLILLGIHSNKEYKALNETHKYIKNWSEDTCSSQDELPFVRFGDYCKDLGAHVTTRKVWLRNALIVFFGIAIAVLLGMAFKSLDMPVDPSPTVQVTLDPNITDPVQKDPQEEIDRLNQKLEEGYITFSINKSPVFSSGASEGNLNIINLEENNYPQTVELYALDEDGQFAEKLYQSGIIPVGKSIPYAKLDVDLDAGEYRVMAVIHAVNGETGQVLGTVNTPLTLTVAG